MTVFSRRPENDVYSFHQAHKRA